MVECSLTDEAYAIAVDSEFREALAVEMEGQKKGTARLEC
jgi:hypothetical protein